MSDPVNLMPLYGVLASLEATERDAAALTLLKSLAALQNGHQKFVQNWDALLAQEDTEERLDLLCHPDVVYALKRLLRGLPSDREAARQGFSLALTELLSGLEFLSAKVVLELLFRFTEIKAFMKGKEERNHMFGRIFGYMSIIRSGMLARPTTSAEDIQLIIDDLIEYSQEKSYLSECCHQVLVTLLPFITKHPKSIKYIADTIFEEGVNTPDQLNVAMALQGSLDAVNKQLAKEEQIKWTQLLGKSWKNPVILHVSNLKHLALLLKESSSSEEGTQQASSWRQHLHPVWDLIFANYFTPGSLPTGSAPFNDFWNVVIDASLFDTSSSHERKFWGFQIFEKVLPVLGEEQIPQVLTTNFMRCFVNNLSSDDRFLNKAAKHTMTAMHAKAETNEAVRLTLIINLLDKTPNFDRLSRSKTVETLLSGLSISHIQQYLQYLTNTFLQQDGPDSGNMERTKRIDMNRQWAVDQMHTLFRNTKVPREEAWIKSILEFNLVHGFFELKKVDKKSKYAEAHVAPAPALSAATREHCRSRFYGMMAELSSMAPLAPKKESEDAAEQVNYSRRLNGTMVDGTFWSTAALDMMIDLEKNKAFTALTELDTEAAAAKKTALALVTKIQDKAKKGSKEIKSQYKAFELLFVHMILQLYNEPEDSVNILGELHDCYNKVFTPLPKKVSNGKKAAAAAEDEEEEELQPVEVILDILLSFLIKPSALLRQVSEQVFVIFCDKMTKTGLELMLTTLQTKDNKDDMFGEEDEEDEDAEADAHNQSDDDDEDEDDEDEDEDDEDEGESEDMEIDEDDNDDPVDEEFRQKLAAALNVEGKGSDDDESEEELLNDDEMMAFDDKLNEIFRQKKLSKAQAKDAKQTLIHFKNKVLDLLEIYIKKQSHNELVLELIVPLLSLVLVPSASNKPIHDKINSILRNKLAKIKDYPKDCDADYAFDILTKVHELAKKSPDAKFSALCGELSLLLIKVMIGGQDDKVSIEVVAAVVATGKKTRGAAAAARVDPKAAALKRDQDRIVELYTASLKEFMTKKNSNLSAKMFLEFMERFPHLAWHMSSTLLAYTDPKAAVKSFRQAMAFNMLSTLVKKLSNKRTPEFEPLFLETLPLIRDSFIATLKEGLENKPVAAADGEETAATTGGKSLTTARLRDILKFTLLSARMAKRSDRDMQQIWSTAELGPLLQQIHEDSRFNASGALRNLLQQMLDLISSDIRLPSSSGNNNKDQKRKREQQNGKGSKSTSASSKSNNTASASSIASSESASTTEPTKKKTHRSKKRKVSSKKEVAV